MDVPNIQENIDEFGWHFIFVFDPKGESADFAYSIGFERSFNHPDIVVFGLKRDTAHNILSDIAEDLRTGKKFVEDTKTAGVIGGEFEVMFKRVRRNSFSKYLGTAISFYKEPFRAWVLFWPDRFNILPTEIGCELDTQNEALGIV